jgi:hypothetical protein
MVPSVTRESLANLIIRRSNEYERERNRWARWFYVWLICLLGSSGMAAFLALIIQEPNDTWRIVIALAAAAPAAVTAAEATLNTRRRYALAMTAKKRVDHLAIDYAGPGGISDADARDRLKSIVEEHDSAITAGVGVSL